MENKLEGRGGGAVVVGGETILFRSKAGKSRDLQRPHSGIRVSSFSPVFILFLSLVHFCFF